MSLQKLFVLIVFLSNLPSHLGASLSIHSYGFNSYPCGVSAAHCLSSLQANLSGDSPIDLAYIQKGRPQQNGFVERFNGSVRREFLGAYLFESLNQVREMAWHWRLDYNDERTHESLGNLPPSEYRQKLENSSLQLSQ